MNKQQNDKIRDVQDLVSAYEKHWNQHLCRIEAAFKGGKKVMEVTDACPNYLEEVIIPTYRLLAESLPEYQIIIPDPKTYRPIKDYYRVKVGVVVVGGFSVPQSDDFSVFFTRMWYGTPIEEMQKNKQHKRLSSTCYQSTNNSRRRFVKKHYICLPILYK